MSEVYPMDSNVCFCVFRWELAERKEVNDEGHEGREGRTLKTRIDLDLKTDVKSMNVGGGDFFFEHQIILKYSLLNVIY